MEVCTRVCLGWLVVCYLWTCKCRLVYLGSLQLIHGRCASVEQETLDSRETNLQGTPKLRFEEDNSPG